MNWRKGIVFLFSAAVLLAGCQKTPDSVKERSEDYTRTDNEKGTQEIKYVSLEHILDNQEQVLKKQYDNLQFQDAGPVEQPESVSVLSLKLPDDFASAAKVKKIAETFFGTDKYDKKIKNYSHESWAQGETYGFHKNTRKSLDRASVSQSGFCSVNRAGCYVRIQGLTDIYHADCGKMPESFQLNGKTISLKKAVDYVNRWCNENWKYVEGDMNYKYQVKTIYRCRDASLPSHGKEYLYLTVCKRYRGIPFEDMSYVVAGEESKYWNDVLEVTMQGENQLLGVRNNNFSFVCTKESSKNEQVIGIEEAVRLAAQQISGTHRLKICDVGIKYQIIWKGDPEKENPTDLGAYFEARPVWCFTTENSEYQKKDTTWARSFIEVDMVNGKVRYQDACF